MGTKICRGSDADLKTSQSQVKACRKDLEVTYEDVASTTGLVCKQEGGKWKCQQTFTYGAKKKAKKEEADTSKCTESYITSLRSSLGTKTYQGTDPKADFFSAYLQRYNAAKGATYSLSVNFSSSPLSIVRYGATQPPDRMDSAVFDGWERGWETQRVKCDREGGVWYWVTYPAALSKEAVPEPSKPVPPGPPKPAKKTLRELWDDFFKNPDVVKAIGLTPSAVQESFTLVFSHYSIINDREQEPGPGDYVCVGLILAGLTLAAAAVLWEVMPGAGAAADLSYIEPGLTAGKVAGTGLSGFLSRLSFAALANPLLALLVLTQVDVVFWAPSVLRSSLENLTSNATGYKITLETAIKNGDWELARTSLANLENAYDEMDKQLSSIGTSVFAALGVNYEDFRAILQSGRSALAAYRSQYPRLLAVPVTFPSEFELKDVHVIDGDSIWFPGHPEVRNEIRFLGIDCHESETTAGKAEKAYLESLIQGKTVRVLVNEYNDPELTIDLYGRLLAGIFLGDQDVVLSMLDHFGKAILVESKYQKKYRWIDWDEYKRTAAAATGPAVQEFKLYVDSEPTGAKLYVDGYYTHHLTPSDQTELKDVMNLLAPGEHTFKASKAGKEASAKVTLTSGANPDIMLQLSPVGLEKPEEEPAAGEAEEAAEPFTFQVLSSPTRARLYIDGYYTHHYTPSDQKELADVLYLLQPGRHTIMAEKAGKEAEVDVDVKPGYNAPVVLTLAPVGLPVSAEDLQAKITAYRAILKNLEEELAALKP